MLKIFLIQPYKFWFKLQVFFFYYEQNQTKFIVESNLIFIGYYVTNI